jgi:hypothetical protein
MLKTLSGILALFMFLGTILLPKSDFKSIAQLPAMYQHCKATEDKDLTVFDFITDHLVNTDCWFDKHDKGDHQKPHEPLDFQSHSHTLLLYTSLFYMEIKEPMVVYKAIKKADNIFYYPPYLKKLFRPPIFLA